MSTSDQNPTFSQVEHQSEDDEDAIEADFFSDSGYDDQVGIPTLPVPAWKSLTIIRAYAAASNHSQVAPSSTNLQHHIFKLVLNGELTRTKLPAASQKVLDVGTGTGIWAIELGDALPSATIVGVDQSPIQPVWVPANVSFEIDDVNEPWLQAEGSIDFIYIRTMAGSIKDWPSLLKEAYRSLKPGGKLEFVEFGLQWECMDGTFDPNGSCGTWTKEFHKIATEVLGMDFDPIPKMSRWLSEAGLEEVESHDEIVPIGPWPRDPKLKNIGRYFLSNMLEGGVENYTMMLFTRAGWDETSVQVMLGGVRRDLMDPKIHAFTRA
ncbi:hypothetical protein PZA11_000248 [Diplocarpon coronariae]